MTNRYAQIAASSWACCTEDELLDLLKAHAQDNLYLGREQSTLRWAIGCTIGELSGRLFPLTEHEHPTSQVKRMTVLQSA